MKTNKEIQPTEGLATTKVKKNIIENYNTVTQYGYPEYVKMKDDLDWGNNEVGEVVGFEGSSVKNQTQPKHNLPIWAQLLVHLHTQEYEGQLGKGDVQQNVLEAIEELKAENEALVKKEAELSNTIDSLEHQIKNHQRTERKLEDLIHKLNNLELESELLVDDETSLSKIKSKVRSLNSKHHRKLKILDKFEDTDMVWTIKLNKPVAVEPDVVVEETKPKRKRIRKQRA